MSTVPSVPTGPIVPTVPVRPPIQSFTVPAASPSGNSNVARQESGVNITSLLNPADYENLTRLQAELMSAYGLSSSYQVQRDMTQAERDEVTKYKAEIEGIKQLQADNPGKAKRAGIGDTWRSELATLQGKIAKLEGQQYDTVELAGAVVDSPFDKEDALADSAAAVSTIFNRYRDSALPQIYAPGVDTGIYNNSTGQLLANDAFARATAEGSLTQLNYINSYEGLRQSERTTGLNAILGSMGLIKGVNTVESRTGFSQQTTRGGGNGGIGSIVGSIVGGVAGMFAGPGGAAVGAGIGGGLGSIYDAQSNN